MSGGSGGYGTVFQMTTNGTLTTLSSFANTNGANPYAELVQGSAGSFYGTTESGGTNGGFGTVFMVTASGTLTTLVSFANTNGAYPESGLVQGSDGNFYGTTVSGGTNGGYGTVFIMTTNGMLTTLYTFGAATSLLGNPLDGANPFGGLIQGSDGNFYGTTESGGANANPQYYINSWMNGYGTVFMIKTNGAFTTLYSFGSITNSTGVPLDGGNPFSSLVQASDGNFYGTAYDGGSCSYGTLFKVTTSGTFTSLAAFALNAEGANPYGGIVQGRDGNFYGTTVSGGTNAVYGTVFMFTTNGTLTTLISFANTNGANPHAGLVQGSDGNFYGTTVNGGGSGYGTVFRVTTSGVLTSLYSFTNGNDGANPYAGLVQGSDGNFYGTTVSGGTNGGYGTVFMMTTNGILTTLLSFANTNGANPFAGLVQGSDGNFYGTTVNGGTNGGYGTVFMATTNGMLTTLVSFNSVYDPYVTGGEIYPNGASPFAGLVQGSVGNFYGTTVSGGSGGYGTVFQVTTNGTLTTIYNFGSSNTFNAYSLDGSQPYGGLVQGGDGSLYGTTLRGGANTNPYLDSGRVGFGTVFQFLTTNGTLTTLISFAHSNGANPYAGPILGSDGKFLYGATYTGGSYADGGDDGYGTVFQIILPPTIISQPTSQTVAPGGNATFAVMATGVGPLTYQWMKSGVNIMGSNQRHTISIRHWS